MKNKLLLIVGIIALTVGSICAGNFDRDWQIVDPGAGATTILAGTAGQCIILKHFIMTMQNACNMYFAYGPDETLTKITGTYYFGANGGWDKEDFGLVVPPGQALKIWFSTDPGSEATYIATKVSFP